MRLSGIIPGNVQEITAKMPYDVIMTSRGRIFAKIPGKVIFRYMKTLRKFGVQPIIQTKVRISS